VFVTMCYRNGRVYFTFTLDVKLLFLLTMLQVGNSVYYNYALSVNGKREEHGADYEKDYLTKLIVSTFLSVHFIVYEIRFGSFESCVPVGL